MPIIHRKFMRWHVWLGWLIGVPIVLWTLTGLVMVARPIEEVRGNHLRKGMESAAVLPSGNPAPIAVPADGSRTVREMRTFMQHGRAVTLVTRADDSVERYDANDGTPLDTVDEAEARAIAAKQIVGGDNIASATLFEDGVSIGDFRRPMPVWQLALADGTHVYIGLETGEIEAVRTRFWRVFDFMWGLHIMDLQTREDTHHPILIGFALLATLGSILGFVMLFTRGKPISRRR